MRLLEDLGGGGYNTRVLLLTVLVALFAVAVLTLAPIRAETPDDLRIAVSLLDDSDGVVQAGSTIQVRADLKFTGDEGGALLAVSDLALRIAGGFEWDASGRRAMPGFSESLLTSESAGSTGAAVAVQSDGSLLTSGIQVVGAPDATVNGISGGGAVHVWESGSFAQRLTGEPTDNVSGTQFWQRYNGGFGSSVDVGGSVIVVGAPYEDGAPLAGGFHKENSGFGFGAAYVFERNSDGEWERTAKLTVGENPAFTYPFNQASPDRFGEHVAISDDGGTIVVSQIPAPHTGENHNWGASAHVFTKPASGWTDMDTNHANVTSLRYDSNGAATDDADVVAARQDAYGDVDISGDGSVVAVGAWELPRTSNTSDMTGAVLVFNRPGAAWTAGSDRLLEQNATLAATGHESNNVRVGSDVAINQSGGVIVSNGAYLSAWLGDASRDPVTGWPGSAFVWVRSTSWADANSATATLSDSGASIGDQFGARVAISDSGDRVVVGQQFLRGGPNGFGAISVFDKPGSGWVNDSAADTVLGSSPWASAQSLALDGESTLLAGVPIYTGSYLLDLDLSDPESAGSVSFLTSRCGWSSSDGVVTRTCELWFMRDESTLTHLPAITIPIGTPDGQFTISASAMVGEVRYTDAIEVTVRGDVDEVAEVTLNFATDPGGQFGNDYEDTSNDKPYPSSIAAGETTRLRLSVLNENGEAAGIDAEDGIASILFTTTAGNFSPVWLVSSFSPLSRSVVNCEGGNGQQTCAVPLTSLNAENADRIVVTLAHPGADKSGTAEVRATVITNDGEVFNPPPLMVTFIAPAESLVVSEPTASVLNVGTGVDDRDVLTLSVTAADKNGAQVDVPLGLPANPTQAQLDSAVRVTVRDPDGVIVPVSRYGGWAWTYDRQQERTSLEFKLHVNASAEEALATGEYTLELRIGTLTAERTFRVGGAPASLALGEPEGALVRDARVTITATVADEDGNAVPDGTAVAWSAQSVRGTDVVLVQLSADRGTKAGSASATYLVIGPGAAVVTARSGDVGDVALLTIAEASVGVGEADGPPPPLSESLSSTRPGFSIWLGEQPVLASELLESLSGIESILLWENGSWLRYGLAEGRVVPGSFDFTVMRGGVLVLGR